MKKTTEQFIIEASKVHNNFYDYSLVDYKNWNINIRIICPIHGEFSQRPNNHLAGRGCHRCKNENLAKSKSSNTAEFISKALKVHNNFYDYSLVEYKSARNKIKIICPKHGMFFQTPMDHLRGCGCQKCAQQSRNDAKSDDLNSWLEKAVKIHNELYDYSLVEYIDTNSKVKIICRKCGKTFSQTPNSHLQGKGCPICNSSKGEKKIAEILTLKNIDFIQQKRFSDCKDILELPFDFYIPSKNLLIEFDGIQHYKPIERFGGNEYFNKVILHDKIKNDFAKKNNFQLLRIRFDENVDEKLSEIL